MARLSHQIEELARQIVDAKNALLIDVTVRGEHTRKVVEVFVDTEWGVTADLCSDISRELAKLLDTMNLLHGAYDLVVSSPGIERPLKFLQQYKKNVGRKLAIKYKLNNVVESIEGKLVSAEADQIVIGLDNDVERKILFSGIVSAKVKTAW